MLVKETPCIFLLPQYCYLIFRVKLGSILSNVISYGIWLTTSPMSVTKTYYSPNDNAFHTHTHPKTHDRVHAWWSPETSMKPRRFEIIALCLSLCPSAPFWRDQHDKALVVLIMISRQCSCASGFIFVCCYVNSTYCCINKHIHGFNAFWIDLHQK